MDFSNNIWVEKYTPRTIDELCVPDHCIENDEVCQLENKIFLIDKRIISNIIEKPHEIQDMLFFSKCPGTGKTSTFELIAFTKSSSTFQLTITLPLTGLFSDVSVLFHVGAIFPLFQI